MDSTFSQGKTFISSRRANQLSGHSMDYIGQLCRAGKLEATQVGRVWFVTEESLMGYKTHSDELAEKRHQEQSAFSKSIYSTEGPLLPKLTKPVRKKTPHQFSFSDSLSRAFLSLMFVGSAAVGILTLGDAGFPAAALAEFGKTFTGVYRDIASVPKAAAKNISGGLEAFAEITEKKPLVAKVVYGVKDSLFKGNEPLLAFSFFGEAADMAGDSLGAGYAKIIPEGQRAEVPGAGFVKKLFAFISGSHKDANSVEMPTLVAQITNTSDLLSGANVPVLTIATSTGKVANINETMSLTGVAPRIIERVINNTVTNNTVERVLVGEVTRAELETRLSDVYSKIQNQLSSLGTGSGGSITNVYQTIAQSQKIDNLSNVTISNPVVTGGTFSNISISGASVSAAPLVTTTELSVTGSATSSFAGGINLTSGCFAVNGVCLTSGGGGGGGSGTVNSGTVGQVAYFDADGTTVSGTSTVFILPNGNVGIGTTTFTGSHAGKLVIDQTHDAQTVLRVANYSDTPNAYSEVSVKAGGVASYLGSTPQNSSVVTGAGSAGRGYVWSQSTGANRGLDLVAASANSDLRLFTGGTAASNERMIITSTGNVGIGTNSPTTKLTVTGIVTAASFVATSTTATSTLSGGLSVGSTNSLGRLHVSAQAPNNPVAYFVNTNTGASDEVLHLGVGAASAGTSNLFVSFYQGSTDTSRGTRIGYIQGTGSDSVTYNTTSDVRLKENIHDTELGLEDLLKIGVKDYNFVTSPSRKVQGFIAQDLNKIYPYAVATTDDGVSPLGVNAIPWGVDYGRITPLIVKSIQDQYALYKKLEGRVADIEARITSNSNTGGFSMDSVISVLQSAGLSLVNGVTSLRELVAETATVGSELKPTGITLYDKQTGQPYCLEISNGAMVQTPGKCVVTVRNPAPVIPPISPAVDQEEPPVVSTTTENGTDGSILENLPVSSTTPLVPEPVQDIASSTVVSENEIHEN